MICKKYSKAFSDGLKNMKNKVAGLWVAIGAKSVTGHFAVEAIKKAGFSCPEMKYPLRNPLQIAQYAHGVSQVAHKNGFDICLQNDITITPNINIIDGKLLRIDGVHSTYLNALEVVLTKIPPKNFALIIVDEETKITETKVKDIKSTFSTRSRPEPFVITDESTDFVNLPKWFCEPQERGNDLCILKRKHDCNGVETTTVGHIHPAKCPECFHSNEDPVIASRATAVLITAVYKRSNCPNCQHSEKEDEKLAHSHIRTFETQTSYTSPKGPPSNWKGLRSNSWN